MDGTGRWGYLVDLDNRTEVERVKRKIEGDRAKGYFRVVPGELTVTGELTFTEEEHSPEQQAQEKSYYLAGLAEGG